MDSNTKEGPKKDVVLDKQTADIAGETYYVTVLDSGTLIKKVIVTRVLGGGFIVFDPITCCCIAYNACDYSKDDTFKSLKNSIAHQNSFLDVEKWTSRGATILSLIKYLSVTDFSKSEIPREINVFATRKSLIEMSNTEDQGSYLLGQNEGKPKKHEPDSNCNNEEVITID